MDEMHISRTHKIGIRTRRATWKCVQWADGSWTVHFVADMVPREDFSVPSVDTLMARIDESMVKWVAHLDDAFQALQGLSQ